MPIAAMAALSVTAAPRRAVSVGAPSAPRLPAPSALAIGVVLMLASGSAAAQFAGKLRLEPTLGVGLTTTNSYRSGETGRERSEILLSVSPGVRLTSRAGRIQGSVDYALSGVFPLRDIGESRLQNRLSAKVRAEVIENHFDVNFTGSITRQPTSVFGRQASDPSLSEFNQSEVREYSVQPVLRGVIGGVVALQASATAKFSDTYTRGYGSDGQSAAITLSSANPAIFGWSLSATRQVTDFEGGRETTDDRLIASVSARPDPDWLLTVRAGQERTDIASVASRTYDNWGAGVRWTPNPRTSVAVDADRRFFGNSYALSAQHRMRRTVLSYSGSRGLAGGISQGAVAVSAYDLFFELFASQEPDPVLRDQLVRSFLDRNGIPPQTVVGGLGFLAAAESVQERHQLSMAVSARRTTVTTSLFVSRTERVDTLSGGVDDLIRGGLNQQGLTVALSHRLTPRDSVSLSASASRTNASGDEPDSSLYSLAASWSTRVSERIAFSVGLRQSNYNRPGGDDYAETAVTTALNLSFF